MRLNNRGAAHLVLALLVAVGFGVVGTYLLVASNAQTPPISGANAAASVYYVNCPITHASVRQGSTNTGCVKYLQWSLDQAATGSHNLSIDGSFGSATTTAVKSFQSSKHLTVDGIVGANTWGALDTANIPHYRYGVLQESVDAFNGSLGSIYACRLGTYIYQKAYGSQAGGNWHVTTIFGDKQFGNIVGQSNSATYSAGSTHYLRVTKPSGAAYMNAQVHGTTNDGTTDLDAWALGYTIDLNPC